LVFGSRQPKEHGKELEKAKKKDCAAVLALVSRAGRKVVQESDQRMVPGGVLEKSGPPRGEWKKNRIQKKKTRKKKEGLP